MHKYAPTTISVFEVPGPPPTECVWDVMLRTWDSSPATQSALQAAEDNGTISLHVATVEAIVVEMRAERELLDKEELRAETDRRVASINAFLCGTDLSRQWCATRLTALPTQLSA